MIWLPNTSHETWKSRCSWRQRGSELLRSERRSEAGRPGPRRGGAGRAHLKGCSLESAGGTLSASGSSTLASARCAATSYSASQCSCASASPPGSRRRTSSPA